MSQCELLNCKMGDVKLGLKKDMHSHNSTLIKFDVVGLRKPQLTIVQGALASDSLSPETKRSMRKKHMMERLRERVSIMFTCTCSTLRCFLKHS